MIDIEAIKRGLMSKRGTIGIAPEDLLSTGAKVLNLAISGRLRGGFAKGSYNLIVGDSGALKTWIVLSAFAEAAINKNFKDYRFIYDGKERGAKMDIERFFGSAVAERIEPPRRNKTTGEPEYSNFVNDFYYNVDDAIKDGRPFIYALDSENSLRSPEQDEQFEAQKKFHRGEVKTEPGGTYNTEKPKVHSENLNRVVDGIAKGGHILNIISQTRQNIGFTSRYNPRTRSGGDALTFYADTEIWTSIAEDIQRRVKGKDLKISVGKKIKCKVKKNRIDGKGRIVEVHHYPDVGIDDTGTMCGLLIDYKHWKYNEKTEKVIAPEFDYEGDFEGLVRKIEEQNGIKELMMLCQETWDEVEAAVAIERKPRYQ